MREIDALGPPKKEANGKVSFSYLKAVYLITVDASNEWFEPTKQSFLRKRRDLLKENNLTDYRKVAIQMYDQQTLEFNEALFDAMNYAGEGFYNTLQEYLKDSLKKIELGEAHFKS